MSRAAERGGVVLFVLAFFAFVGLMVCLIMAATGGDEAAPWVVMVPVSFAVLFVTLRWEARRDPDTVLTFVALLTAIVAIGVGVYLAVDGSASPPLVAITVVAGVATLALCVVIYRREHAPEDPAFPNILLRHVPRQGIFERLGVQLAAQVRLGGAGEHHEALLLVQNCHDAPAKLRLSFDAETQRSALRCPEFVSLELGPAEVVRLIVPVVTAHFPGKYSVYLTHVGVEVGGRRVRRWRSRSFPRRISQMETVFLAVAGHFSWGGGLEFTFGPSAESLWPMPQRPVWKEVLWRPSPQGSVTQTAIVPR